MFHFSICDRMRTAEQQAAYVRSRYYYDTNNDIRTNGTTDATLLILLSVQVGLQPVLMKWYAKDTTNVGLRVIVIEGLKFIIAVGSLMSQGELVNECRKWDFKVAAQTTLLPSLIYVVQNYLNQTAVVILDGVTFNILNQTKIIWTAILVFLMLGKRQSQQQIVALFLLIGGALIMTTSKQTKSQKDTTDSIALYYTGVVQALLAALLSGFAGTIVQKALQNQSRNAYLVTIELSVFGVAGLLLSMVFNDSSSTKSTGLWDGWTFMTYVTMLIQAVGGIIVGFVIKYTGNVEKSFAVVAGLVLTALIESTVNHQPFGVPGIVAVGFVALSTKIYTTYPYKAKQSSTMNLNLGPANSKI